MKKGLAPATDRPNLRWIVEKRCAVQHFHLELLEFAKSKQRMTQQETASYELLVGVAYALWRTVFIVTPGRRRSKVKDAGTKFLETLTLDNAIGYVQEKNNKYWTSGFYLNDAYFRLQLCHALASQNNWPFPAESAEIADTYWDSMKNGGGFEGPLAERWEQALSASQKLLAQLACRA